MNKYLLILPLFCFFSIQFLFGSNLKTESKQLKKLYSDAHLLKQQNLDSAKSLFMQCAVIAEQLKDKNSSFRIGRQLAGIEIKMSNKTAADSIYQDLFSKTSTIDSNEINCLRVDYAYLHYLQSNIEESRKYLAEALSYFKRSANDSMLIQCYINSSKILINQNDYPQAMEQLSRASIIAETNKLKHKQAIIYSSIGKLYYRQRDFDQCLTYFKKALDIQLALKMSENIASSYQNIGTIYIIKKDYTNAELFLKKAAVFFKKTGGTTKYLTVLNSLGVMYKRQKEYNKAIEMYNEIFTIAEQTNSLLNESNALLNLSQVNVQLKKYKLALSQIEKSISISKQAGETDFRDHYQNMASVYEKLGNYKLAFDWLVGFKNHSDSITDMLRFKETENIKERYETEKKELLIEKIMLENKNQEAIIQRERTVIVAVIVLFILFVIFFIIVRKQNKQKLESYKILVEQSEKIALTNQIERNEKLKTNSKACSSEPDKSSKQTIPSDLKKEILNKLYCQINEAYFYKKTDLSISEMAQILNTNTKYLSQVINDSFKTNFSSFVNQLRVEEAQRLLKDKANNRLTLEVIGLESGFKSKSVFNTSFKKITGITPSVYKMQIQKNIS